MEIKDVENLAELAKLELSEEEKVQLLLDVNGILDYVKIIEGVNVKDVEPEYITYNVWREDEEKPSVFSRDLIISQFPDSQPASSTGAGGDVFLKVKKIL